VAVTLSRLKTSAGWISRLTDGPLGWRIRNEIRAQGVDVSRVLWTQGERVGTYFVEIGRAPRPGRIIYDRVGSAMATINPDDVDWGYVRTAKAIHLSGITPGLSPSCRELVARCLHEARTGGLLVSFDVNYRARVWTPADAAATLGPLIEGVSILISTASDADLLFGAGGTAVEAAQTLQDRFHPDVAIVTSGVHFAAVDRRQIFEREGYPVDAVDRIGAGDAFAAGFLHGFLGEGVERGLAYGTALAALKHTYYGDTAWVTEEDVQGLMSGGETWR
jgi:2-dehydro-3-deoxygluconokinase